MVSGKKILGLDLGGTTMTAAVVSDAGKILFQKECNTEAEKGRDHVINRVIQLLKETLDESGFKKGDIAGIGLGVPGPLNSETGIVSQAPNLPGWKNVPLRDIIEEAAGLPVYLENDANAATVAEFETGAGRDVSSMIMLTLGTGIGGGIILGRTLWKGPDNTAGEIGHMIIRIGGRPCNCGSKGCLETYSSATAITNRMRDILERGDKSSLAGENEITAEKVFAAAQSGDASARGVIEEATNCLAAGITSLANIFNIELVVLGGGMANAGTFLLAPIREQVKAAALRMPGNRIKIETGILGGSAGVIGAALCFKNHYKE